MKNNKRPTEKINKKKSQVEQNNLRPEDDKGSLEKRKDTLWVFNSQENSLEYREVNYAPGLYKIFDEILVNATNNFHGKK